MNAEKQHWTGEHSSKGWAIIYDPTPEGIRVEGGTSFGLRFPAFQATDLLGEPEKAVKHIAGILNEYPEMERRCDDLRTALQTAFVAMRIASALPGVADEYDFGDAIKAAEAADTDPGGTP